MKLQRLAKELQSSASSDAPIDDIDTLCLDNNLTENLISLRQVRKKSFK